MCYDTDLTIKHNLKPIVIKLILYLIGLYKPELALGMDLGLVDIAPTKVSLVTSLHFFFNTD
jgi:hypothetical protein